MKPSDFDAFSDLIQGTVDLCGRAPLGSQAIALWWRALQAYPLAAIERAVEVWIADARPGALLKPADVLGILGGEGQLSADEAWAIACRAMDEADTVVWNAQIAQAWGAASEVMNLGDEVGARMAFRAAYERLERERRLRAETPNWTVSPGTDAGLRQQRVQEAIALQRLAPEIGAQYALPAPTQGITGLLENAKRLAAGSDEDRAAHLADEAILNLKALRCLLDGKRPESPHQARLRAEQARAAENKAEQMRRVDDELRRKQGG